MIEKAFLEHNAARTQVTLRNILREYFYFKK